MENNLDKFLATEYNPYGASQRALDVGILAANFVAAANELIRTLHLEAGELRSAGLDVSDPRVIAIAQDSAYLEAVIKGTSKAATESWVLLHKGR